MEKSLIVSGFPAVVALAALLDILATGVFAQGAASLASSQASITSEQAQEAVLAANPGTSVVEADQDKDSGSLVYEVKLDNGLEVQVDASRGAILGTDQEQADWAGEWTTSRRSLPQPSYRTAQRLPQSQDSLRALPCENWAETAPSRSLHCPLPWPG